MPADIDAEKKEKLMATGEYDDWTTTESPFLYLTAELPPPPLFKDELHENIIPQINLVSEHLVTSQVQWMSEYRTSGLENRT